METKSKMTQCDRILDYIEQFGSISQLDAFVDLGVYRLASRIHDLRCKGYAIKSETKTSRNRFGEPVSFKVYSFEVGV